jgi:C-terminal processing protease CtpA/Prc
MSGSGRFLFALIIATATSGAAAQGSEADAEARALAEQAREMEQESERKQGRREEIDVELREAEERLAEAAARIAELSQRRLPAMIEIERRMRISNRPMLGVTIGADDNRGPVEGVTVQGVTPGSAAAESGLRAGDVITAVNDESLSAETDEAANRKLLDFLEGVEEGDTLDVEYLRDGRNAAVEVKPRAHQGHVFALGPNPEGFMMRPVPGAPAAPAAPGFNFRIVGGGSWSDMEMVSLTRDLGQYFGTDDGLLVVRAPSDEQLKLRDGDVIQRIDGREPTSVSHAMRILGSYQEGETLRVEIMRNRKKETISIEIPDRTPG